MSNDWWFLNSMGPKDKHNCRMVYKYGLENVDWDSNIYKN